MALKNKKDPLKDEVYMKEAYIVGLLWANPDLFHFYSKEKLNTKHFGNGRWKFYFGLGRHLFDKKINVFDDITVANEINELKMQAKYERHGEYEVMEEMVSEVKGLDDNFEAYYEEVKKYALLRDYRELFGDKVIEPVGKYDYKKMSREQLTQYWTNKLTEIASQNSDSASEEFDLLDGLEDLVVEMDEDPDIGLPYYKSKKLHETTNGWAYGTVTIHSAFSGNGKTSFAIEKLIMSCIYEREKLLIVANEMDVKQYRKMLLVTIMGTELYEKFKDEFKNATFNRKNLNKGNFTEEEKSKLIKAVKWVQQMIKGENNLIKFVPMEDYTMDNVEATLRRNARKGYRRVLIDTAKPSEGGAEKARWERFVEDFEKLYKLARKDGGGLDLAMWCTVQNADDKIGMRFLDERCIADGKKIKNIADVVFHMRPVFPDEYEGGQNELKVTQYIPASESFNDVEEGGYEAVERTLKHGKVYYLMFVSKNRRGQTNITGLDVLVYECNFNANRWKEVGWSKNVKRDIVA